MRIFVMIYFISIIWSYYTRCIHYSETEHEPDFIDVVFVLTPIINTIVILISILYWVNNKRVEKLHKKE